MHVDYDVNSRISNHSSTRVVSLQEDEDPGWDGFRVMMGDVWPLVKMSHCHTFRAYSGNIHLGCSINHVNHLSSLRHPNMWERFTKFPSILCMWKTHERAFFLMYPPKFKMEPDNNGFQKDFPFKGLIFRFHAISGV